VTSKQVEDIVTKFLREHPESRHLSAAGLVARKPPIGRWLRTTSVEGPMIDSRP
jgi:hypothetical protein